MVQILVFANNEEARVMNVRAYQSGVNYLYSGQKTLILNVDMFFATFLNGESGVVLVAADRYVSRQEILKAHAALIN
ncbi:hypothetical protein [Enterobacter ludwigii]|uniref:hypothetical protein n=1 Tax=Enterobacter ludwigii TaxID=299767 RepID=UPI003EF1EE0A